jgi:hypothetical protein
MNLKKDDEKKNVVEERRVEKLKESFDGESAK